MPKSKPILFVRSSAAWLVFLCIGDGAGLRATDYFLTIGGGYQPSANQASLEANVLFFREVLVEKHRGPRVEAVFFADGNDPADDLQVLSQPAQTVNQDGDTELIKLLESLYSYRGQQAVEYRNHQVSNVSGANSPGSIRANLQYVAQAMEAQDRLFVYVTAHGGKARGRNQFNTSISCWDGQSISAREFARWLDDVPPSVPVIMVMAQCYCGGFAHTIFENAERSRGLAPPLRIGFYAQQHDLPAAGCRPDIANDEEYSSYFWGAFVGRTRNGRAMDSADINGDQRISLAEAHCHAMLTSPTIDIPLRASEELLRVYSRISGYDHRRRARTDESQFDLPDDILIDPPLASLTGAISDIASDATPEVRHILDGLLAQLDLKPDDDVATIFDSLDELHDVGRYLRRTVARSRRGSSGRRELRSEIARKWPELSGPNWRDASVLRGEDQAALLEELEQLPSFARFQANQQARQQATEALEQNELREVKFERLIYTLETIVLARNLPRLAPADVLEHYQRMIAIEQSTL